MKKIFLIITFVFFQITFTQKIHSQTDTENKIKTQLPTGVFLREIERIPDLDIESYAGIYIEEPKIAGVPENIDYDLGLYFTCPESTNGQAIYGTYHLFLFQKNKIISDIIIPSSDDQYDENNETKQSLCYYNTKFNNCFYFYGYRDCDNLSKVKLEKTKLINFKDCTGRGLRYEFILVGDTYACGWTNYLVAGYDLIKNEMVIYPVRKEINTYYWFPRFLPNNEGVVIKEIQCGDHGNETYEKQIYKFDNLNCVYELINIEKRPCE